MLLFRLFIVEESSCAAHLFFWNSLLSRYFSESSVLRYFDLKKKLTFGGKIEKVSLFGLVLDKDPVRRWNLNSERDSPNIRENMRKYVNLLVDI